MPPDTNTQQDAKAATTQIAAQTPLVFFTKRRKASDMAWALPRILCERHPTYAILPSLSIWRAPSKIALTRRVTDMTYEAGTVKVYQPLHFPQRPTFIGHLTRPLQRASMRAELAGLGALNKPPVLVFRNPIEHRYAGAFGEQAGIYLAMDDNIVNLAGGEIPGEIAHERVMLGKVDAVLCVSEVLASRIRDRLPQGARARVSVLPNGFDARLFNLDNQTAEPAQMGVVPRPRVVTAGHISARIDWAGVEGALADRPQWHWIFVGHLDLTQNDGAMARCLRHPRVHVFEPIAHSDVPAWLEHADACAAPYTLNAFSEASDPLKVLEYLAAGRPCLSTRGPALQWLDSHIHWVDRRLNASYASALDACLDDAKHPERGRTRTQAVASRDWRTIASRFMEIASTLTPSER